MAMFSYNFSISCLGLVHLIICVILVTQFKNGVEGHLVLLKFDAQP